MAKTTHIDYEKFGEGLRKLLMNGPLAAADICRNLGISQPTFSRILARNVDDILVVGRASKTQYALRRNVPDVGTNFAIYKINEAGETSKLGDLHGIHPAGFYFASKEEKFSRFFDDLPYFIDDLRPNGFLGRLIPSMHPELNLPKNINDWSSNDSCICT